jgi:hypothetical protein
VLLARRDCAYCLIDQGRRERIAPPFSSRFRRVALPSKPLFF